MARIADRTFSTLTEFAVALAGFAGVASAISHRGDSVDVVAWIRTLALLTWASGAAFASVLPMLGASFGVTGIELWAGCSLVFVPMLISQMAVLVLASRRLSVSDRALRAKFMWALALGGNSIVVVWQLLNASGAFASPSPGPLTGGIVWLLAFSALNFIRMVVKIAEGRDA